MSDTFIHLGYFFNLVAVCLCFVWIFFTSQLLSNMLASIIYPSTCCLGEFAACWSAANTGFCFSWSVLEYERERPREGNSGFLQALWRLTVGASGGFVSMCVGSAATYPLQLGSMEGRLCSAKGCCSFLSRHLYNRALSSWAFSLPGGAYKTIGIFWVQFGVLVFQWCISMVLQEFIYLFIYPFIYTSNVLSAYCN